MFWQKYKPFWKVEVSLALLYLVIVGLYGDLTWAKLGAVLLSLAVPGWGATYYVDADSGNDSTGDGSIGNPWQTATDVCTRTFGADDIILLKRNTVAEYGTWTCGATHTSSDGHPITLGAYGSGNKPILNNASTALTGWGGSGPYTKAYGGTPTTLTEDGKNLYKTTGTTPPAGQWSFDTGTIYYTPTSGVPGDHTIKVGVGVTVNMYPLESNYIFQDLAVTGYGFNRPGSAVGQNVVIQRCDFYQITQNWTQATTTTGAITGFIVQDCTFDYGNAFYFAVTGNGLYDGLIVRRNVITHSNQYYHGELTDGDRDGFSVQTCKNSFFENNNISGECDAAGGITIWFPNGLSLTGNKIRYNYIHDCVGAGIVYGGEDSGAVGDAEICYNIIVNCGVTSATVSSWSATPGGDITKTYGNNIANDYSGTTDTYLVQNDADWHYDGSTVVAIDKRTSTNHRNTLLKFTGLSNLSGQTITGATLYLRYPAASGADTILVKKCLRNWVVTQATWNVYSTGNSWTTAGGLSDGNDRAAATSVTLTNTSATIWSGSNAQLAADVQAIADGGNNYGWVLEHIEVDDTISRIFESGIGDDDGYKPYISVTYSGPSYSYTYQATLATEPNSVTENFTALAKQSSIANVEATAGSYYWASNVLYIHATDGSNPSTNGKTYKSYNSTLVNSGSYSGGIYINRIQTSGTPTLVANNSIFNCDVGILLFDQADYFTVKNNLVVNSAVYQVKAPTIANNVLDYNCYYPAVGTPFLYAGVAKTWADWKTAISGDANSITSGPLFANAGGSYALDTDFKLKSSSPCINKGAAVGLTRDYFNKVVPQGGAVDIGAVEYQGGVGFW